MPVMFVAFVVVTMVWLYFYTGADKQGKKKKQDNCFCYILKCMHNIFPIKYPSGIC